MYVSVYRVTIGSDNGLSPIWHKSIIQTNAVSIGHLGTNFSEILIKNKKVFIHENASENIVCESFVQREMS